MNRRALALVLAGGLAACGGAPRRKLPALADQISTGDRDPKQVLIAELQADVLDAYERDEPPELETSVLPAVGAARIGVGPGDVMVDQELANASSRWPLMLAADTTSVVRSKRLELHLATDQSAAWISDEVSWRIGLCGRTLVIPLRLTAMYGRDGDRWVLALEHVSTGAALAPAAPAGEGPSGSGSGDDGLIGRTISTAEVSEEISAKLTASMQPLLRGPIATSPLVSSGPETALFGPQWTQEWHGPDLVGQTLVDGKLTIEEGRAGVVGRTVAEASVGYWVGTLIATSPGGVRTRLRATFVFERRAAAEVASEVAAPPGGNAARARPTAPRAAESWVVVQGHVSLPVDDETLARGAIGSALLGLNPLTAQCGETSRSP